MRRNFHSAVLAAVFAWLAPLAQAQVLASLPACNAKAPAIRQSGYVRIGGIEQWVTIQGRDCANPVVLMLHGGPGNPLSPYADAIYGAWEKDFTLVQWDQRGAGLTWSRNKPGEDDVLSVERMAQDGTELAAWLTAQLGKKKVILFGSSWGSILGVHMAKARPELFHAYVGTAQVVGGPDNQGATYMAAMALATAAGDQDALTKLTALGAPPWSNPRNFGVLRRITRKYEAQGSTPPPKAWWQPAAAYATPQVLADFEQSEEYSYLQFVGFKGNGMLSKVDLPKLGTTFAVPVFLLQGDVDLVTTPEVSRRYFDRIQAPKKAWVTLPRTGHDPNQTMVDGQFQVLMEQVRPLVVD